MKKRVVFDKKHHFSGKYRSWQALSGNCLYVKLNANCKPVRSTNTGMNNTHAHQNTCTCPACQPEKMPSKPKISTLAMRRKTCN
jgi:hypothetical protein